MKASELIEKLKTFDENLILKDADNRYIDFYIFEYYEKQAFILNSYGCVSPQLNIKSFIEQIKKENENDYKINCLVWIEIDNRSDVRQLSINLTQQNEYLIIELE